MRRFALVVCASVVLCSCALARAQAQPRGTGRPQSTPVQAGAPLPVRRVVLYKSGIGYFEHLGRVRNDQSIAIDFNSAQLDDVLKSLTAIDLGNGRVTGISYNSDAPLARRLGGLQLPAGERPTMAGLLTALRGARVEVRGGSSTVTGRVLGVERRDTGTDQKAGIRDQLTLITDHGEIRIVELTPAVVVRLAEPFSSEQVGSYLSLLASARVPDRRRLTIDTRGTGDRDLLVSYISEVPIWKTSYRIVLAENDRSLLQGWAIVDNTTGDDWTNVDLSLVAGAPQSFIQQLSQPLYGRRPVVQTPQTIARTPQTHDPTLIAGTGTIRGAVRDASGAALPGVTVRVFDRDRGVLGQTMTNGDGTYSLSGLAEGPCRIEFSLPGFKTMLFDELVSATTELTRIVVLQVGSLSETVVVSGASPGRGGGAGTGRGTGRSVGAGGAGGGIVGSLEAAPPPPAASLRLESGEAAAIGQPLADLFEYRVTSPITIPRNQSALVPIASARASIERVSVWNGRTGAQPLRALWLTNTTDLTLDAGSFTVIDGDAFAGEGLMDPLKPLEKRLLSYATDLGVQVDTSAGDERQTLSRLIIQHGVITEQRQQRTRRVYTIRNNNTAPRTLLIEHPRRAGWALAAGLEPAETSTAAYRFRVPVGATQTTTFTVEEQQPAQTEYQVSSLTPDRVSVLVRDAGGKGQDLSAALAPILDNKTAVLAMVAQSTDLDRQIKQASDDEQRVRENMRVLKDTPEERRLARRYAAQLEASEMRIDALRKEQTELNVRLKEAVTAGVKLFQDLAMEFTLAP